MASETANLTFNVAAMTTNLTLKVAAVDRIVMLANTNPLKIGKTLSKQVGTVREVKHYRDCSLSITNTDKSQFYY